MNDKLPLDKLKYQIDFIKSLEPRSKESQKHEFTLIKMKQRDDGLLTEIKCNYNRTLKKE